MPSAAINAAQLGDVNQIVPGKPGMVIDVLGYTLIPAAAVVATFTDGPGGGNGSGAAITGPMSLVAPGLSVPVVPPGIGGYKEVHFSTTTPGGDLTLQLGAATQVSGHLTFNYRRL